ncbi:MAG: hypothetical protein VKN13_04795 [Cyanobacteriota bacterium]|nr:hypothetical protein [Cyanobacteriota bacterium]
MVRHVVLLLPLAWLAIHLDRPMVLAQSGVADPADTPALGTKEKQVLERIRQLKVPRWRSYGVCRYDWSTWRLSGGGVRVTASECGDPAVASSVGVHCDTLRITRRQGDAAWEPWRLPYAANESSKTGGEDLMVAALCANVAPGAGAGKVQPGSPPPLPTTPSKAKGG